MPATHRYPEIAVAPGPCPSCGATMTAGVLWAGGRPTSVPGLRDASEPDPPVHVAWGVWCDRCGPELEAQVVTVNADPSQTPHAPWLRVGLTPSGSITVEGGLATAMPAKVARALADIVDALADDLPKARADQAAAEPWSLHRDEGTSSAYADGPKGSNTSPAKCMVRLGWVRPGSPCYSCGDKHPGDGFNPCYAFVLDHGGDAAWVVAVGDEVPYVCTACVATAKVRQAPPDQRPKPALRLVSAE